MAPGVTAERSGRELEEISDNIDTVNVLKSAVAKKNPTAESGSKNFDQASEFDQEKDKTQFRKYHDACESVKAFYREQHTKQTVAYNLKARHQFHSTVRARMTVWEAIEKLNTLIDESDPDTSLSQIDHLLQTAEAIRRDGKPRWMQLTGLIHDLGKLLYFYGAEGQWDVVGDTFPVGCAFEETNIYPETFSNNPDYNDPIYSTKYGIYSPNCGIGKLMISWGHDEYIYQIAKEQSTIPAEGLAMLRYHSFYPWHSQSGYKHFMNENDEKILKAVQAFNPYDLYSKSDDPPPDMEVLKPYYLDLIDEFFPNKVVNW
ncbi:inositol oxygenase [Ascodesmis nigricans]|uniref:Inositol oxygenase n=1 Tax=Ascodesmis nigricans TaxID=341454 RepID=A0A4S2MH71_9PEZI|nr:inositol oxygenase [Ascodesmis nigricans]